MFKPSQTQEDIESATTEAMLDQLDRLLATSAKLATDIAARIVCPQTCEDCALGQLLAKRYVDEDALCDRLVE